MNIRWRYILFFTAVLLSRLPFLSDGYGLDGDAWGVALTAFKLKAEGVYEVSRFPGYPVQEFLSSIAVTNHFFTLNLLTAIVSSLGVLFFVMALHELRFRAPFLAGAALAAVPVLYINSTLPLDYTFALAFQMAALYFLSRDQLSTAGVLMGLAIGTRITSGALMLPLVLLILDRDVWQENLRRVFHFVLPALMVGAVCFFPVYQRYGFDFLSYYEVPYPSIEKVLYKFLIEVWGPLGLIAITAGIILLFLPERFRTGGYNFPHSVTIRHVLAWLFAIDLYIIAFLKLPMEAGYLLPIVPFVIMVFGKYLVRPAFRFVCVLLIFSPFFISISPDGRPDAETASAATLKVHAGGEDLSIDFLKGPVVAYESRRLNSLGYCESVLHKMEKIDHHSVLISGQWYNQLIAMNKDTVRGKTLIAPHISESGLLKYYAAGNYVYYLFRQDLLNQQVKGADPSLYGAELLR